MEALAFVSWFKPLFSVEEREEARDRHAPEGACGDNNAQILTAWCTICTGWLKKKLRR